MDPEIETKKQYGAWRVKVSETLAQSMAQSVQATPIIQRCELGQGSWQGWLIGQNCID